MFKTLFKCCLVHYIGYPKHMDEWISKNKLVSLSLLFQIKWTHLTAHLAGSVLASWGCVQIVEKKKRDLLAGCSSPPFPLCWSHTCQIYLRCSWERGISIEQNVSACYACKTPQTPGWPAGPWKSWRWAWSCGRWRGRTGRSRAPLWPRHPLQTPLPFPQGR